MAAPLPAEYRQHAANVARWFPEVLLTLGAPGLEERCAPPKVHVATDACGHHEIEVILEHRLPEAVAVQTVPPPRPLVPPVAGGPGDLLSMVSRLEGLAADYEALAQASQGRAHSGHVDGGSRGSQGLSARIDVVAEGIATLSWQLQALQAIRAPTRAGSGSCGDTEVIRALGDTVRPQEELTTQRSMHCRETCPVAAEATASALVGSQQTCRGQVPTSNPSGLRNEGRTGKDLTPCTTPGSGSRGGRQGRQGLPARQAGRSRAQPPDKAAAWRTERDSEMRISINKVPQMVQEPASPKFVKRTKTWGGSAEDESTEPSALASLQDRSAAAVKERIDKKLSLFFGSSQVQEPSPEPEVSPDSPDLPSCPCERRTTA